MKQRRCLDLNSSKKTVVYACATLVAAVAIVWYLGNLSAMDVAITAAVVRAIASMNAVNTIWLAFFSTVSQIGALKGAANHGGIKSHAQE